MNTAEVIGKISKKAGIPETETKKFFEIFLKQTSGILNPGESVKIPGVGLFQLRVGQIEKSSGKPEQQFVYSNLIVFIGEENQTSEQEEIIFNVPTDIEEEYHPLDSYFSLSLGKPIIPLKGVKADEFFIPPSGPELRGLFESKVTRLLEEAEKTGGGKETEIILLKSRENSLNVEPVEEELPVHSDFLKTREFENLSWDFGENLSQEIEEEASPELKVEFKETEKISVKEPEEEPHFEEEDSSPEHPDEELFEEVIEEETEWIESEEVEVGEEGKPEVKSEGEPEITEIKSENKPEKTIDELSEFESEPMLTDIDFKDLAVSEKEDSKTVEPQTENNFAKIIKEKENKDQLSLKNFQRVSSLTKEFNISVSEGKEKKTEPEKSRPRINEVRGGFQKVRRTTAEFNFDFSGMEGLDEEEDGSEKKEIKESASGRYKGYRKSGIPTMIITGFVIIVLAALIYFYLNFKSENNKPLSSKPQTKVIERNNDVPVTYPYNSSDAKTEDNKKEDQVKNESASHEEINSGGSEITESVNAERIENYIYQYPEGIVVQVSSWKSKSVAVGEVKKYRNAGYKAFAEMSTIPGMGLYYRVRVGYFNSLNEAKEFANRNQ